MNCGSEAFSTKCSDITSKPGILLAADTAGQIVIMLNTGPRHGTRQGHSVSVQCQLTYVKYSVILKTCRNTALIVVYGCVCHYYMDPDYNIDDTPKLHTLVVSLLVMSRVAGDLECINTPTPDRSPIITLPPVARQSLLTTSWSRWPGPHSSCYFLP